MARLRRHALSAALLFSALAQATLVTDQGTIAANKTFDYVIVGAGLTGITVGNKVGISGLPKSLSILSQDLWVPQSTAVADRLCLS